MWCICACVCCGRICKKLLSVDVVVCWSGTELLLLPVIQLDPRSGKPDWHFPRVDVVHWGGEGVNNSGRACYVILGPLVLKSCIPGTVDRSVSRSVFNGTFSPNRLYSAIR